MTHKNYKKYTLFLLIITVTALVITAAMLSLRRKVDAAKDPDENGIHATATVQGPDGAGPYTAYYTPNPALSQENSGDEEESTQKTYLITIYKGRIGVFESGRATPVLTGDTQVYLLPNDDIQLLKKGIRADSMNEVKRILEDYD